MPDPGDYLDPRNWGQVLAAYPALAGVPGVGAALVGPGLAAGAVTGFADLIDRAKMEATSAAMGGSYNAQPAMELATGMIGAPVAGLGGTPRGAVGSMMGDLFHGSPRTNLNFINPSRRGPFGEGVYASPMPGVSERYAGSGGQVYKLQGDFDVYQGLGARDNAAYAAWKSDKDRLLAAVEPGKREAVSAILERSGPGSGYDTIGDIQRLYGSKEATQDLFKRAGFQGVSGHVDGPEVALFGPHSVPADKYGTTLGSGFKDPKGAVMDFLSRIGVYNSPPQGGEAPQFFSPPKRPIFGAPNMHGGWPQVPGASAGNPDYRGYGEVALSEPTSTTQLPAINPALWEAFLAAQTPSVNIEDRRR